MYIHVLQIDLNKGIKTRRLADGNPRAFPVVLQIDLNKGIKTTSPYNTPFFANRKVLQIDLNKGIKTFTKLTKKKIPFPLRFTN